jgi:hypothetical protein
MCFYVSSSTETGFLSLFPQLIGQDPVHRLSLQLRIVKMFRHLSKCGRDATALGEALCAKCICSVKASERQCRENGSNLVVKAVFWYYFRI